MAELTAEIKLRVSVATKLALSNIANERGEGTNISDICREAIRQYLDRRAARSGNIIDAQWRVAEDAPPYSEGDAPKKGD